MKGLVPAFAGLALIAAAEPAATARAELAAQAAAWNRGDLEGALARYCPSADITWVNRSGLTRGFESFAADMRQQFRDRSMMGTMRTEVLEARDVGKRRSLIVLRWSIESNGKRLMSGISTQLWAPCQGATRVVFEHAS